VAQVPAEVFLSLVQAPPPYMAVTKFTDKQLYEILSIATKQEVTTLA